jgi:photosystem II stability/assembly factor-like uncharacterized protein
MMFRPTLEWLEERTLLSGLPAAWVKRGAGGGGAFFSPAISPYSPAEAYMATDMSELFHTTDEGVSWQFIDFRQIQAAPDAHVQFTEAPQTLYSLDYTADTAAPALSTNGGINWHRLANDPTGGGAFKFFADPNNHKRLLLSDYTSLYFSADAGTSWAQKFVTTNTAAGLHVAGAFFDGPRIYVGTNSGLLVSTDGGATFAVSSVGGLAAGQVFLSFAGAKQNGLARFVAVTKNAADVYAGIQGTDYQTPSSIYTLTWGHGSWTLRGTGIDAGALPFFAGMALNNINVAYVAGGSTDGTPTVYKTTDGGAIWQSVLLTVNNQNVATGWSGYHGDRDWSYGETALGFTVAPNDAGHAIITDYGFAHATTDGGASWQQLYVVPADQNPAGAPTPRGRSYHESGLDNTSTWGVTWTDPSHLIISSTDIKASISSDGGNSFSFGYTGDNYNTMYRAVVQPATGTVYAATSSVHDMYESTTLTDARIDGGSGAVLFSADMDTTWQTLHNFGHPVVWVATDPTNANRLYAAVIHSTQGGIYVTNDAQDGSASVWAKLSNPPRTEGHPFNIVVLNDGTLVVTYSGRRAGSTLAFTASSGVFVSTDGGQTWADRSDPGMVYWTKDVVVDPYDATQNTWYVGVFSGWGGPPNGLGGLYRTTDRGLHWTKINAQDRVESVTFSPTNKNLLFMTTETQGLWVSQNVRSTTPTFTQLQTYPFEHPERVFYNPYNPNEIWVSSFGDGLSVGTIAPAPGTFRFSAFVYQVTEANTSVVITVQRAGGSAGTVSVHYATTGGTAIAGTDYVAVSGTLQFLPGETVKTFTVQILDDQLVEHRESLGLALDDPTGGATVGSPSGAILLIVDNQPPLPNDPANLGPIASPGAPGLKRFADLLSRALLVNPRRGMDPAVLDSLVAARRGTLARERAEVGFLGSAHSVSSPDLSLASRRDQETRTRWLAEACLDVFRQPATEEEILVWRDVLG